MSLVIWSNQPKDFMKSVSLPASDSTSNTTTTYFYSKINRDRSLLNSGETAVDTFEIYSPDPHYLPSVPLKTNNNLWGNLLFTVLFMILFAFVRLRGKDLFYNLFNILIKRKKVEIILNEGISSNLICYVLSLVLSYSVLSALITYIIHQEFLTISSFYIFTGLFLYHFLLLLLVRLLGWTFDAKVVADEVMVNIWTYHISTGLWVAPFIIASFFIQKFAVVSLLKLVIASILFLLIVKIIRWIEILFSHRVSILYMILYLCALEIMPLLILFKVVA